MRHDAHYVETLAASAGAPVGRMVPIDQIDPNPDQPRQAMGDLAELISSVTEKGIIEPLVVRQRGPRYQIIAGERRYHASVQAGLTELPVVIRDVDDREMLELALVENIQRKDLTPFEESEAMQALAQRCGYTHEDLAKRLGKSRTSITEGLSLNGIPPEAFVFAFRPPSKAFNMRLSFNKKTASKDEVIAALENILQELKHSN